MNKQQDRYGAWAVVMLFVLPWLFYFPAVLKPMAIGDNLVTMWHTARFAFEQLRNGIDPLWNPYICSGFPVAGYANTGMYSITNLPHLFLPHVFALTVQIMLVHGLAGLGLYLFTRKLGASVHGALVGGVAFSFSGFFSVGMQYSYFLAGAVGLGFVMFALEKVRESDSAAITVKWTALGALFLGLQVTAGHPQLALISGLMYGIYVMWHFFKGADSGWHWRLLVSSILIVAVSIGLTAALWLPAMELVGQSYREALSYKRFIAASIEPLDLFSSTLLLKPGINFSYWLGIPAALLCWRALRDEWARPIVRILFVSAMVAVVMGMGGHTPLFKLLYQVPVLNRFTAPMRYGLVFCFAFSCLAALGWDSLSRSSKGLISSRLELLVFIFILLGAIAVKLAIWPRWRFTLSVLPDVGAGMAAIVFIWWNSKSRRLMFSTLIFIGLMIFPPWIMQGGLSFEGQDPRPERKPHWEAVEKMQNLSVPPPRLVNLMDLRKSTPEMIRSLPAHNLSSFVEWSNAGGYQPLMLDRYFKLFHLWFIGLFGDIPELLDTDNLALDLLNVRTILIPSVNLKSPDTEIRIVNDGKGFRGVRFGNDLNLNVEAGDVLRFRAPEFMGSVVGMALISGMGTGLDIPQGYEVAEIILESKDGDRRSIKLKAGVDTAEIMYQFPNDSAEISRTVKGIPFFESLEMPLWTGLEHTYTFRKKTINKIAMITYLYNAEKVEQDSPVAQVEILSKHGPAHVVTLKAGVDTAHWMAGMYGIETNHKPAEIAENIIAGNMAGHTFLAIIEIDPPVLTSSVRIKSLLESENSGIYFSHITMEEPSGKHSSIMDIATAHLKPTSVPKEIEGPGDVYFARMDFPQIWPRWIEIRGLMHEYPKSVLHIKRISFKKEGGYWPVHPVDIFLGDSDKYEIVHEDDVGVVIENKTALPRAWLAEEIMVLGDEEILSAIKTGKFPDGGKFDPLKTALLEKNPGKLPLTPTTMMPAESSVRFDEYSANRLVLSVANTENAILVLSEIYYPGWETVVDGVPVDTLMVDYILRGVPLSAGTHKVEMRFRPKSVRHGRIISLISLLSLIIVLGIVWRKRPTAASLTG